MTYRPYKSKESKGHFRSLLEKRFASWLNKLKLPFSYEPVAIPYVVPAKDRTYTPDFVINKKTKRRVKKSLTLEELDGMIIIETKGRLVSADRNKMIYVRQAHPHLDIRFVFPRDEYLTKQGRKSGKGMKYSDWCKKEGFEFHIGIEAPKEWFKQ